MLVHVLAAAPQEAYVNAGASIVIALIASATTLAAAAVPYWLSRRRSQRERAEYREVLQGVHEQVANSHKTNLRDDLDGVTERLDRISGDIGSIKDDGAETKRRLKSVERRLNNHIDGR